MPRRHSLRATALLLCGIAAGAGCSSGNSGSTGPAQPQLGQVSSQNGLTTFAQSLRAQDDLGELVPGFANMWDLDRSFAIASGGDIYPTVGARPHFAGALSMRVAGMAFPADQTYAELTYRTPEFGTADGLVAAVVYDGSTSGQAPGVGTYSMALAPTQNARLTQTLDLTSASTPITLDFLDLVFMDGSGYPTDLSFVEVAIRDTANGLLQLVYYRDSDGMDVGVSSADLSAYAGQVVRLSIRGRSTPHSLARFDEFSVLDGDSDEYVTNGGFESGTLSGWSRGTPSFVRNVTSGARTLSGLSIQRSFYAPPTSRWGRMVDVFTNNTGATIAETVSYEVNLGSNGEGIIYDTPGTFGLAVTSWDSTDDGARDVGWVFGGADTITYTSDDALGVSGNGNAVITATFDISVDPGQSVALAHFLVLHTDGLGNTATSVNDTADVVDAELQAIVAGWPTDGSVNAFTSGLTQAQIDAVTNL